MSFINKNLYEMNCDEVCNWLDSKNLRKFIWNFQQSNINGYDICFLTEEDLKNELLITSVHERLTILKEIRNFLISHLILSLIYENQKFQITLDFDYTFKLSDLILYAANVIGVSQDNTNKLIFYDSNHEILSPNCKIIELMLLNPTRFKTLYVKKHHNAKSEKNFNNNYEKVMTKIDKHKTQNRIDEVNKLKDFAHSKISEVRENIERLELNSPRENENLRNSYTPNRNVNKKLEENYLKDYNNYSSRNYIEEDVKNRRDDRNVSDLKRNNYIERNNLYENYNKNNRRNYENMEREYNYRLNKSIDPLPKNLFSENENKNNSNIRNDSRGNNYYESNRREDLRNNYKYENENNNSKIIKRDEINNTNRSIQNYSNDISQDRLKYQSEKRIYRGENRSHSRNPLNKSVNTSYIRSIEDQEEIIKMRKMRFRNDY